MHLNSYKKATEWLFQQFPSYQKIGSKAYKPTLENTRKLLEFIGNPQDDLRFIHVAGSNGKGSVCSMLASILKENGEKTGLFTSPHIVDFSERIRVNGIPIDEQSVVDFVERIKYSDFGFAPSFFEVTFALSLLYFKQQKCSICVIETGLGGRLDSTNVIQPLISVITNISLEHTAILGDTIDLIATEKAGIIKENTPIVSGDKKASVNRIFQTIAEQKKADFYLKDSKIEIPQDFPLLGKHQKENFQLAISALRILDFDISENSIQKGLKNIVENSGFKARLQIVSEFPRIILDVSHNEDGIEKTISALQEVDLGKIHLIYGTSSDKDIKSITKLFPDDWDIYLTEFKNQRSASKKQLEEAFLSFRKEKLTVFSSLSEAMKQVQGLVQQEDTILIMGSFFLVSDFTLCDMKNHLN